jgi:hypothetical protein
MEYVRDDGKIMAAMLVKSPKGRRGFDVMLDGDGNGYWAPTKGAAIAAFAEAHGTLEAAPISEEDDDPTMEKYHLSALREEAKP